MGERYCDHENITLWQLIIVEWQQKWNLFCSTGPWRTSLSIWASARRGKPINCHPPRSFQFQPPLSPHRPCWPPQLLYPSPPETPVKVAWVWGNAGAWQPAPEDCTGTHQVCQSQTASIHHSLRYILLSKLIWLSICMIVPVLWFETFFKQIHMCGISMSKLLYLSLRNHIWRSYGSWMDWFLVSLCFAKHCCLFLFAWLPVTSNFIKQFAQFDIHICEIRGRRFSAKLMTQVIWLIASAGNDTLSVFVAITKNKWLMLWNTVGIWNGYLVSHIILYHVILNHLHKCYNIHYNAHQN